MLLFFQCYKLEETETEEKAMFMCLLRHLQSVTVKTVPASKSFKSDLGISLLKTESFKVKFF